MSSVRGISANSGPFTGIAFRLIICLVSCLFFLWPGEVVFPAGIVSVSMFVLVPVIFPRCRVVFRPLVTPLNWMIFAFSFQLVIMPVVIRIWGVLYAFLPSQPSMFATNISTLVITVAYVAFAAAIQWKSRTALEIAKQRVDARNTNRWPLPTPLIISFALLGMAGLAAKHKSIGGYVDFLQAPAVYLQSQDRNGEAASVLDVFAQFFSFFAGLSLVMMWSRLVERGNRLGKPSSLLVPFMLIPIAFVFSSYNYNRGNFVFPLIALAAAIGRRAPRMALRSLVLIGSAIAILTIATVVYRNNASPENIGSGPSSDVLQKLDTMELFQLYAQAPQYMAFMLEGSQYGVRPTFGLITLSALGSQIPEFGRPLRPFTGYTLYANLTGHDEENPAFAGEVFLDFNIFGVVGVYAGIGVIVAWLQKKVLSSSHAFEVYIYQMMGLYLIATVLLSVEVLGLFAIYSMFPIYAYLIARRLLMDNALKVR